MIPLKIIDRATSVNMTRPSCIRCFCYVKHLFIFPVRPV